MKIQVSKFSHIVATVLGIGLIWHGLEIYRTGVLVHSPNISGVVISAWGNEIYFSIFYIFSGIGIIYSTYSYLKRSIHYKKSD